MDLKRERVEKREYADHVQRRRTLGFLTSKQFHRPNPCSQTPPPHEQYGWCNALLQDSVTLVPSSLLFYLSFFSGEMRDILGKFWIHSCWSSTVERDTLQLKKRLCLSSLSSLTGLMAANGQKQTLWEEHTNKKVNGSSLEDVQQNSSIPIFSTLLKKRQLYHEKKRKILKKVCEMSKYLTLIPLLREMCFPYYHSCLEKKMTMILGNWNFYVFSFGKSIKCDWVLIMKPLILLFPREESSSPFPSSICHPQSILCPAFIPFYSVWQVVCPHTIWRQQALFIFHVLFFICFISISVYMAGDKMAAISFDRLHRLTLLPRLSGFSFFIPNILLPVSSCSF